MLIDFVHPVIVSGTGNGGRPRYDLVRVASQFEIEEHDGRHCPISFEYSNTGSFAPHQVRSFDDGRHYLALPFAGGVEGLLEDRMVHNWIVGGQVDSFDPLWEIVRDKASDIRNEHFEGVNNMKRDVSRRERSNGIGSEGKACLKAPTLKNWRWLGPDVDGQVAEWKGIVAEVLENVVLVDGVLHLRCFEPCLVLDVENGTPKSEIRSRGVYQRQVHKRDYDNQGLIVMGKAAKHPLSHYFSAADEAGLEDMRAALGWKIAKSRRFMSVHDHSRVSSDYFEMETVRHARMLLEFGQQYAYVLARRDQADLAAPFHASADDLRTVLLDWQEGNAVAADIGTATDSLSELIADAPPVERGFDRFGCDPIFTQRRIQHFRLREDMAEVSLTLPSLRI